MFVSDTTRKNQRWCSVLLLLSAVDSFVLPRASRTPRFRVVGVKGEGRYRFSAILPLHATNSTATAVQDDIASILNQADPSVDAPLPPAFTECPFNGIMQGPKSFYRTASDALGRPPVFSFLHRNQPTVEVSGGPNVRELLNLELATLESNAVAGISQVLCGTHSLRTARDRSEHKAIRDLVGVPLAAKAVAASIPTVEAICRKRIQEMLIGGANGNDNKVVRMIDVTQAIALDITWQQVLGLDLRTKEDIDLFHDKVSTWLSGAYHKLGSPEMDKTLEARKYLVQMIEQKIDRLKEAGESDGSTVGGLVFATIDECQDDTGEVSTNNMQRSLSKEEVIDNALVLIFGAVETTSSTMANAVMLMGLHPDVWRSVVEEQKTVMKSHGESFTKDMLERDFPYLEAVIDETMRMMPVTLVSKRKATETIVLDCGYQLPKGWMVSYNIYLSHQLSDDDASNGMDLIKDFHPLRWLNSETRPRMVDHIPFGAGPRKCPGITLAKTEMKIFLSLFARSVQNYELVMEIDESKPVDEQIEWKPLSAVPLPEDGVSIRVLC